MDAQYYQIADDASGRQFLRELRDAGARGVRVRLLVDDLYAGGEDALLAGLAAQPGVQVRLFNPLPVRDGSVAKRALLSLHDFARVNRRMHNKLLVADNAFAISGGRNIADAYFERSEPANFIDMDVLSAGPGGARDVGRVRRLLEQRAGLPGGEPGRAVTRRASRRAWLSTRGCRRSGASHAAAERDALGQSPVGAQLAPRPHRADDGRRAACSPTRRARPRWTTPAWKTAR